MSTQDKNLQTAAIVCEHVASMKMPILYAERSEPEDGSDSGWQFLCAASDEDWHKSQVWALHEVVAADMSLAPFIDAPPGTVLTRLNANRPWEVEAKQR